MNTPKKLIFGAFFALFMCLRASNASKLPEKFVPLVAVPGYLASRLSWSGPSFNGCYEAVDQQPWWFYADPIVVHHECTKYHVSVNYNFDKPLFENVPSLSTISGSSIHVYGETGFQASGQNMGSPYFDTVQANLVQLGYTPCNETDMEYCDFAVTSWVWPYAPASYYQSFNGDESQPLFEAIRLNVEKLYSMTGEKVAVLGHSEGGMSLAHFLIQQSEEWKNKFLAHAIFVAPAFATWETTYAPLVGLIGSYQVPDWLPQFMITDITKSWPGNLLMLPNDFLYSNDTEVLFYENKSITLGELNDMYSEFAVPGIAEAHKIYRDFTLRLKNHPGIKAFVYSGSQQPTSFQYDLHREWFADYFAGATVRAYTDGDGTLPLQAVRTYAEHWMKNTSYYTNYTDIPYMIHSNFIGTNPGNMAWINRLCKVEPCVGIQNANNLCPSGYACKTYEMKECADTNEYSPNVGAVECLIVPEGYYKVSNSEVRACPEGSSCSNGIKSICGAGYHTNGTGQSECISNAGLYRSDGEWKICPSGYWCNSKMVPCPMGTFSNVTGASKPSTCIPCSSGEFSIAGSTQCQQCNTINVYQDENGSGECKIIPPGFYKISLTEIAICPINSYCIHGYKYNCPHPSYNPLEGQSDIYACNYCSSSQYSKNDYPNCYDIPEGYYKVGASIEPCKPGHFCIGGIMEKCEISQYQPNEGSSSCIEIPNGYYTLNNELQLCPAGSKCLNGEIISCEQNMYQPLEGASDCLLCPIMGYTNEDHISCNACPPHSVCDGTPDIHECSEDEIVDGEFCEPCEWYQFADIYYNQCVDVWDGFYYLKHHSKPVQCEEGFYCLHNVRSPCPEGYWSIGGSSTCFKV